MLYVYVKGYFVFDKLKEIKCKMCLFKFGSLVEGRKLRDSVILWDSEEVESEKSFGKGMG